MFKKIFSYSMAVVVASAVAVGCGSKESWTVTCPWAPSGVAAMVSQKAATLSTKVSNDTVLVADAIKGDAATINTWVMDKKANDPALTFVNEGLLAITPIIDPKKARFTKDDFIYIQNLYSSIFVLSSKADLNIKSIDDLKKYIEEGKTVSVAVNGATSAESFLATALFKSLGVKDFKLTPYTSAAEAAQAVSKGETLFAVSHQSQILESSEQGKVNVVAAFDNEPLATGPFKGTEGVGQYNLPYFKNLCLIVARAGTDTKKIEKLQKMYNDILKDPEMTKWLTDTMLLEVNLLTKEEVDKELQNVSDIVNKYKDSLM